jgi:hypothetical protein
MSTITKPGRPPNPKTLPKLVQEGQNSSPSRAQNAQNLYVAYRKKKLQVLRQREEER